MVSATYISTRGCRTRAILSYVERSSAVAGKSVLWYDSRSGGRHPATATCLPTRDSAMAVRAFSHAASRSASRTSEGAVGNKAPALASRENFAEFHGVKTYEFVVMTSHPAWMKSRWTATTASRRSKFPSAPAINHPSVSGATLLLSPRSFRQWPTPPSRIVTAIHWQSCLFSERGCRRSTVLPRLRSRTRMIVECASLDTFRSLFERLNTGSTSEADHAGDTLLPDGEERFPTSASARLATPRTSSIADRPSYKARRRKELYRRAADAFLSSCIVHGPAGGQIAPVTFMLSLGLSAPCVLGDAQTSPAISLTLRPIADDDALPDEILVPDWATEALLIRPGDDLPLQRPEARPQLCTSLLLRPLLFPTVAEEQPWFPNGSALAAFDTDLPSNIAPWLAALRRQMQGRLLYIPEMEAPVAVWPLFALRVSGRACLFLADPASVSVDGTSECKGLLEVGREADVQFGEAVILNSLGRKGTAHNHLLLAENAVEPYGLTSELAELRQLVDDSFFQAERFAGLSLRPPKSVLVRGPVGVGKGKLLRALCRTMQLTLHVLKLAPLAARYAEQEEEDDATQISDTSRGVIAAVFRAAKLSAPSCLLLPDADVLLRGSKDGASAFSRAKMTSQLSEEIRTLPHFRVMVVGLASDNSAGLGSLQQLFASHVQVPSPDALRRAVILEGLLRTSECATADLPTSDVANRLSKLTPGYLSSDLEAVLAHAAWNAALRSLNGSPTGATAPQLVWDDFKFALSIAKASQSVTVEQSRPSTSWDSIGGYNHIIQRLRLMVETSLLSPDSFNELGVKPPSGVLLLGEPGCGKTVLANALGSNPALNFLSISASEVFSKYLGESERYIRDLFAKAKRLKPCLLLFDEIDAIGTQRGAESEASNGVPERILSTMLNEMDGVETMGTGLFILGCTNRLDMVDQALLRPGRFDRVVKIPPPDRQDRVAILEALRRRTPFPEELVNDLAMRTDGFVAGDIAGIVNDAANAALRQSTGAAAISRHSFDTAFEHFARKRAGRSA